MVQQLDSQRIDAIFQSRPDIVAGIKRAADSPGRISLFNEIASHVYDRLQESGEPAQKRRKVGTEPHANETSNGAKEVSNAADEDVLLQIKEISVTLPQRKKLEICLTQNHIYARVPGTTAPLPGASYAWQDIEYAFYLPIPEKAQVQHNYVLLPRGTCWPSKTNPAPADPLVFTIPATAPKPGTIGGSEAGTAAAVSDTYKSLFHWAFERRFKAVGSAVEIVSANPDHFHSVVRQPHRPKEKAVHVGGFRGSKDGYLFFLENGIFWGFKKPLIFIPLNRIAAISYTNILQITFNMVVDFFGENDVNEELEFGMLDQQDYGGIDDYVKNHRLQDRSMAEQRKAKLQLAENKGPKKNPEDAENGDAEAASGADGMTELERAQLEAEQVLQNDEDEDEEDYDPGSDGESEGSGSSDDDDDDEDEDGEKAEEVEGEGEGEEDDGEGQEEEAEEDDGEGQEEEAEEDDNEEEAQQPAAPVKIEAPSVPVRSGWATIKSEPNTDVDMDEEKFDVVG